MKPRRPSPQAFQRGESYEFGELTKDASLDIPRWRTKSVIRSGDHFLTHECRTVQEYLNKNPDNLRPDRTFTFYHRLPSGERTYMHAGNPAVPNSEASALGDADVATVPPSMALAPSASAEQSMSHELAMRAVTDMLQIQRDTNRDLMAQLSEARNETSRLHEYYGGQMSELQTQLMRLKTELEEARRQYNELEKEYKIREEFQSQVNTLQDKIEKNNQGFGLQDIMQLVPHVMPLITAFLTKPSAPAAPTMPDGVPMPHGAAMPHGAPMPQPMPNGAAMPQPHAQPHPQPHVVPIGKEVGRQ